MVSFKQAISGLLLLGLASAAPPASPPTTTVVEDYKVCIVEPCAGDSSYAIEEAFAVCGHNEKGRGKIQFLNETYTIARVMNTTSLKNVDIDLQGTLSWDNSNITYWLNNSLPVGYQNQSSAWLFGGANIHWTGHGYGTLNGNGQAWYDFNNGASNYPRRPHQITIGNTTNSVFESINFLNSQMWTMTIIHSENITLEDIYVNSTSINNSSLDNTDCADTIYANNITFRRWTCQNGDDSISQKANSTNILMEDCIFYNGDGIALGSIGQYNDTFEYIQNVTARNMTFYNTEYAAYIKTWTGIPTGYPPNGGGGGIGYVSDVHLSDLKIHNIGAPFSFTQCVNYEGVKGNCDTSTFNIHDITFENITGTIETENVAVLQCSGNSTCYDIQISDVSLRDSANGTIPNSYLCSHVEDTVGFNCTGPVVGENDSIDPRGGTNV